MRRNAAVAAAAVVGVAAGAVLAHFRNRLARAPAQEADPRTEELRRKLAEAKSASAEEDEFQAAGMGAETLVQDPPRPAAPASPASPPDEPRGVGEEFEAMRRRIHEEGRAAAEEMRRGSEPSQP